MNIITGYLSATSGTVTVGGKDIATGDVVTISKDGATVVATPNSGVTFLGWIDMANHKIL